VVFVHDLEDGAGGDVARDQVAVLRYHSSRKYQRSASGWNADRACRFCRGAPRRGAFAARGLGHEAEFIVAGNAGGMDLDELAVGVVRALLVERRLRRASADHRVGGLAEDGPDAAVQTMIASAGKVRTSIERRSRAQMPRQTPLESSTAERNSQPSYFLTLPSDSWRRTCSSSA